MGSTIVPVLCLRCLAAVQRAGSCAVAGGDRVLGEAKVAGTESAMHLTGQN